MTRPVRVKICGLREAAHVEAAVAAGAAYVGFVFFPKSPRNLAPEAAAALAVAVPPGVAKVGLTVDADDATLDRIVASMAPDVLQLHGRETPERAAELKARYRLPVMKAFAIREGADLDAIAPYRGIADRFLFDAKPPKGAELPGGNGVPFDWRVLAALEAGTDYLLSGGLNAENVGEALRLVTPAGIDVSSGVESAPGIKDVALIKAFFQAVRAGGVPRAVRERGNQRAGRAGE